jgi:uncharacterized membrane protein YgcG
MYKCIFSFKTEKGEYFHHGQIVSDQEYRKRTETEKRNFEAYVEESIRTESSSDYPTSNNDTYEIPTLWSINDSDSSSSSSDNSSFDFGGGDSGGSGSGGDF